MPTNHCSLTLPHCQSSHCRAIIDIHRAPPDLQTATVTQSYYALFRSTLCTEDLENGHKASQRPERRKRTPQPQNILLRRILRPFWSNLGPAEQDVSHALSTAAMFRRLCKRYRCRSALRRPLTMSQHLSRRGNSGMWRFHRPTSPSSLTSCAFQKSMSNLPAFSDCLTSM